MFEKDERVEQQRLRAGDKMGKERLKASSRVGKLSARC